MKFVCDNCKAKYQIGDEKVAGKTVRMKCRRCGYEIRVRAEGVEGAGADLHAHEHEHEMEAPQSLSSTSISSPGFHAGPPPPPRAPGVASLPHPPAAPQRVPIGVMAPRPGSMPRPTTLVGHAAPAAALSEKLPHAAPHAPPPRPAPAPAPHPLPHAVPHPTPRPAAAPPRSVSAPVAPRPVSGTRPGGTPSIARPVTRASSTSLPAVHAEDAHAFHAHSPHATRPAWSGEEDESTSIASGPPSFSAPSHAAHAAPSELDLDWYVGIRGTPTGPIHATEIRARAAAGDVDGDSLVWREGMAEWKPLRSFSALLAAVDAARAPEPMPAVVLTPGPVIAAPIAPPPATSAPFALAPPRAPTPAPAPVSPVTPAPRAPIAAPPTVAPVHVLADPFASPASVASVGRSAELSATLASSSSPIEAAPAAASAPVVAPAEAKIPTTTQPSAADAPLKAAATAAARARSEAEADLDAVLGRRRPTHPMAYAFIAAAAVFGGVAAWVLLTRQPTIVVVQAPAPNTPTPAPAPTATGEGDRAQVEVGEVATGSPQAPATKPGAQAAKPKGTSTATSNAAPIDTSGFVNNVPGPAATGPSGGQSGGGGQLSQGEISAVVSQNQPLVKRKCWQPALEARPPNGATTARVNGSITIGASGSVESASASGAERDFPGLSSCIQSRMKGWKFPPSGGPTTVNVPFVFAGQ